MYCRECGYQHLSNRATMCPNCYSKPLASKKHCQDCGAQTEESQEFCESCNAKLIYVQDEPKQEQPIEKPIQVKINHKSDTNPIIDEQNYLANFASACCWNPIVGIVLYIVWKDEKPKAAQSVCYFTLIGFIISIIVGMIFGWMFGIQG